MVEKEKMILMTSQRPKQQKRKLTKEGYSQKKEPLKTKLLTRKVFLSILLGSATLFGALTGTLSLLPRVSVTALPPIEKSNPFSAPFIISNDGIFPLHSVTYRMDITDVKSIDGGRVIINDLTKTDESKYFIINILTSGEKATTGLPLFPFQFQSPIAYAEIRFVVIYRPDYLFWKQEKYFRFGLTKDSNNSWTWLPRAMSE